MPDAHLIGFSLGAHAALKHAARHGAGQIDLIAPAAPLQLGGFMDDMAGAPVFRAAQSGTLGRLTWLQGVVARVAPSLLRRIILSGAAPKDAAVFAAKDAQQTLNRILRRSLVEDRAAYTQAVTAYVEDWTPLLAKIDCPVTLWHGTADTWAPFGMSVALKDTLSNATLNPLPDHGHYSALVLVLPRLAGDQSY